MAAALILFLAPCPALAHAGPDAAAAWSAWRFDPLVAALLVAPALLYALGAARLWRRAGAGRGVAPGRAAAFAGGLALLAAALLGPLDAVGAELFWVHMAQHMVIMALAAPLLVLGAPLVALLAALPGRWAARCARRWNGSSALGGLSAGLGHPLAAALLQAVALAFWHLPPALDRALADEIVHDAMHASYLAAGLLFWWSLARGIRRGAGWALLAVFGTMAAMGLLAALLTFAPRPLYAGYLGRSEAWGLTALEDQQLAGLVMWVPAAVPYVIGGLAVLMEFLKALERRCQAPPENVVGRAPR